MKCNRLSTFTYIFTFFLVSHKCSCVDPQYEACAPRKCGRHKITYPFYIKNQQESYCGYPGFEVNCSSNGNTLIHIPDNEYIVDQIFYANNTLRVYNAAVLGPNNGCLPQIRNTTLETDLLLFNYVNVSELVLLSNCSLDVEERLLRYRVGCEGEGWGLAMFGDDENLEYGREGCGVNVVAPVDVQGGRGGVVGGYEELVRRGFVLNWRAGDCSVCEASGGRCGFDYNSYHFRCFCPDRPHLWRCQSQYVAGRHNKLGVILGAAIAGGLVTICAVIFIIWHRNKWNYLPYFLSRNTSSVPSSAADLEGGSVYFGVPVFSYSELEEATNNFDPSKELGDGGFGTVYYGKLRDGREVAVKRLYENNYKRVEQFMNEIEILKCLRHPNLVVLYGCTSRRSSELLLVYEYIPNGTVADHIHGDRSSPGSLPWPTRMNIAVETASALVYLHASDIIHRDVKTNNILLDSNFCVKVADFGLSRLFPCGVTHVSTAPQGTPGYVDPEYHQCYQLTDKSDVYSFGVVLIELISSMPAVDITRHRHEINLANLAINRIQNNAFNELIDPSLGFRSDAEVERMTTCVAELAFRCLQLEKEMRPAMVEVLEALKEIRGDECNVEKNDSLDDLESGIPPPPSPESDVVVLLKNTNRLPSSPNSVADKWVSSASNTASSIG